MSYPFKLAMYTNEYDFVIAKSQEDAVKLTVEAFGYSAEDLVETLWSIMPPEQHFCYQEEINHISLSPRIVTLGMIKRDRPVQWFIDVYGEGYFACSEF